MPTENRSSNTEIATDQLPPCADDVFKNGVSVCLVGDVPKHAAETICQSLSGVTGWKIDWHYIGGRTHIMALAQPAEQFQGEPGGYPPCDYCGIVPDHHPWHGSGLLSDVENRHIHACDACRGRLPLHPGQHQGADTLTFKLMHPFTKERRTVTLTKAEVADGMEDTLYEKLVAQFCQCEPVGETNVVDCNCDEYCHDFDLVADSASAQAESSAWRPLTAPGQIQLGDWLSFTVAGKFICAQTREILNPGASAEEVIYNRRQNHYFVTSMAIDGSSTHKGVLVAKANRKS